MRVDEKINRLCDPTFFEENRLAACSDHKWYESEAEAKKEQEMSLRYSLNGMWKFHYAKNPLLAPEHFESEAYACDGFQDILVPGHMELQGYGVPQYTDTSYPWDGVEAVEKHEIPKKHNPTGSYVRYFTIPNHMMGKRLQLHMEGVETAFFCWLNGTYIGYGEDSYTPSVFDITDVVKHGENKLAVQVFRFSSGSWLEDQDFWRMGGIIREVAITALPEVHIQDIEIKTELDKHYKTASGEVDLNLNTTKSREKAFVLDWKLQSPLGQEEESGQIHAVTKQGNWRETIHFTVENTQLWSAEIPNLYKLYLTVRDERGTVIESVYQRIGFRKVEIKDSVLYMNGKRLVLYGVNRHEFSHRKGRAIGRAEMEWDIQFLKRNHFNAVRTSHYPNQTYWYELCDQYGLYVMDETNLETHGTWHMKEYSHTLPGDFKEWRQACLSRAEAMLERDKNHPCIFSWSVGNESWSGQTLYDMSMYFRERDPSRPVHYENVCHDRKWEGTTDFESRMYATVEMAKEYLNNQPKKPYLLCEYSHGMGNSCGNLSDYIKLVDEYEQYCGGFIWDYMDQSLEKKDVHGNTMLAYGGDFDDRPTDYNFCTNGLIYSDRKESPKMQEVRYLHQPYDLKPSDRGVTIKSRKRFEDGENFVLLLKVEEEGEVIYQESTAFTLAPLAVGYVPWSKEAVDFMQQLSQKGTEYVVTALLEDHKEQSATYVPVADIYGQCVIHAYQISEERSLDVAANIVDGDSTCGLHGRNVSVQYNKITGRLSSYKIGTVELVYDPYNTLLPNFWRAPTDNDEGNKMKGRCATWKTASLYPIVKQVDIQKEETYLQVSVTYDLNNGASCQVDQRVYGDGRIHVTETYEGCSGLPDMLCFGMAFKMPLCMQDITWYGRGPKETYVDRCAGGQIGTFSTTPSRELPGYVVPQECGNHVDTRWVTVRNKEGIGIKIQSNQLFEFAALPYTCHELEQARHLYELPRPYATVLRLNAYQTGVGGDNSWGAWALEPYILRSEGTKTFDFWIHPICE